MKLPFSDNQFHAASIAYGIRNVSDPVAALKEMARVVKPGGHVMILETGDAPETPMKKLFEFYFRQVVPRVGGFITGQRQAYEYLNRSSLGFPSREGFIDLLNQADAFAKTEYVTLLGGASFMYKAQVK
jgi:demethylmenaquinone methyltransferase/2-methoxy-6-polyprenyl-1,4-benzoquinol methylase